MSKNVLAILFVLMLLDAVSGTGQTQADSDSRPPNIVFILADDLGYGELGSYGQKKIKTPNLDDLARRGMRFTQHYSGSPVCASSRCVLLTGKHTGHAWIRGNTENGGWGPDAPEGQTALEEDEITIAELLKERGYNTAAIGKWGLGGPGSVGHPNFQGFDLFYGYLCQRVAHNYYPTHLWHNHDVDILGNSYFAAHQKLRHIPECGNEWDKYSGKVFAPDRMIDRAEQFIDANQRQPFFLYYATPVPHVALQVPQDSLDAYTGKFDDQPYLGDKGYLPHPTPRAAYAGMISRMDRDVGRIIQRLRDLKIEDQTLILFSSDNGPTYNGGVDASYFNSAGRLRGLKGSVYEGGIRVPLIACWPGKIDAGSVSGHVSAFQDFLPTACELTGCKNNGLNDGISFAPTLMGNQDQQLQHQSLYWELRNQQAVRFGDWKLVRKADKQGRIRSKLFNLADDIGESNDLSSGNPEVLAKLAKIADESRTNSKLFPSPFDSK